MTDKMQNCRRKSLKREFPEKKKITADCPCNVYVITYLQKLKDNLIKIRGGTK
jgi:hypothetical protein